jgi:tRNA(fMet)-specific endonuclease VapC
MIVLDSNILIEIFDKNSSAGEDYYNRIVASREPFCTTALNLHEVKYGLEKYAKTSQELSGIPTLDYTAEDAKLSSSLELMAERKGRKVRRTDSMIAATVINNGARIFTLDTRHFRVFEGAGLRFF